MNSKEADAAYYHIVTVMNAMLSSIDEISFHAASFWRHFLRGNILFECLLFQESLWIHTLLFSWGALGFCNSGKIFHLLDYFHTILDSDSYYVAVR
jgi:hypothetical protein